MGDLSAGQKQNRETRLMTNVEAQMTHDVQGSNNKIKNDKFQNSNAK